MIHKLTPKSKIYIIHQKLGQGGYGLVYEATRKDAQGLLEERVAVKILKSKNRDSVQDLRWKREYESLKRVLSPNCVKCIGIEIFEEGLGLILELIEGTTLQDLVDSTELTRAELDWISESVKKGLRDLDHFGLFHGDLNLQNIMIDQLGQVKLLDFGLGNRLNGVNYTTLEFAGQEIKKGAVPSLQSDLESWDLILGKLMQSKQGQIDKIDESGMVQENLGYKVKTRIQTRTVDTDFNSNLFHKDSKKSNLKLCVSAMIMLVLLLSVRTYEVKSEIHSASLPAILEIRTLKAGKILIDGVHRGYAPLKQTFYSPGQHYIEIRFPRHAVARALTLRPGDHILVTHYED